MNKKTLIIMSFGILIILFIMYFAFLFQNHKTNKLIWAFKEEIVLKNSNIPLRYF